MPSPARQPTRFETESTAPSAVGSIAPRHRVPRTCKKARSRGVTVRRLVAPRSEPSRKPTLTPCPRSTNGTCPWVESPPADPCGGSVRPPLARDPVARPASGSGRSDRHSRRHDPSGVRPADRQRGPRGSVVGGSSRSAGRRGRDPGWGDDRRLPDWPRVSGAGRCARHRVRQLTGGPWPSGCRGFAGRRAEPLRRALARHCKIRNHNDLHGQSRQWEVAWSGRPDPSENQWLPAAARRHRWRPAHAGDRRRAPTRTRWPVTRPSRDPAKEFRALEKYEKSRDDAVEKRGEYTKKFQEYLAGTARRTGRTNPRRTPANRKTRAPRSRAKRSPRANEPKARTRGRNASGSARTPRRQRRRHRREPRQERPGQRPRRQPPVRRVQGKQGGERRPTRKRPTSRRRRSRPRRAPRETPTTRPPSAPSAPRPGFRTRSTRPCSRSSTARFRSASKRSKPMRCAPHSP